MKLLNKIQKELKAPKGQFNSFGKYNYRSCEDILEAVKPVLGDGTLVISDEMVMLGDRFYVKAIAILKVGDEQVKVEAYAREALDKKGMDESQITGAASSYARKYALNGLFLIDDTKDADTKDNTAEASKQPATAPKATKATQSTKPAYERATEAIKNLVDSSKADALEQAISNSKELTDEQKAELLTVLDVRVELINFPKE